MKTTKLRPHKVLGRFLEDREEHSLMLTSGNFAEIVFSYKDVKFEEDTDNDVLRIKFEYEVHEVPDHLKQYDKVQFEKELGDFLVELMYYGLERDFLGFVDDQSN